MQTKWTLTDESGTILNIGGPYPHVTKSVKINKSYCKPVGECFHLNFTGLESPGGVHAFLTDDRRSEISISDDGTVGDCSKKR